MAPIIAILAKVAVGAVADKVGSIAINQTKLEKAVAARIQDDPALKNDLNAEPLWQSRVASGSLLGFVAAGVIVAQKVQAREFDAEFGMSLAVVVGTAYAFAGRALNWSSPMWSRIGKLFG